MSRAARLFALLALVMAFAPARADELKPGYLELTQTAPLDWKLTWKAPQKAGLIGVASLSMESGFQVVRPGHVADDLHAGFDHGRLRGPVEASQRYKLRDHRPFAARLMGSQQASAHTTSVADWSSTTMPNSRASRAVPS